MADLHRRKDEFLAVLSHELRNPLAAIINAVQLLDLQKDEDPLQEKARRIIRRQVGNLVVLVNDLLEVSRILSAALTVIADGTVSIPLGFKQPVGSREWLSNKRGLHRDDHVSSVTSSYHERRMYFRRTSYDRHIKRGRTWTL